MYFLSEEVNDNQKVTGFEKVATQILKQQKKLGKLQGLSVNVKSLAVSNLKRLVKNGAVVAIPIAAISIYLNKKLNNAHNKLIKEYDKEFKEGQEYYDKEIKDSKKDIDKARTKIKFTKNDHDRSSYYRDISYGKEKIKTFGGFKKEAVQKRDEYHKDEKEKLKKQKLKQIGGTSGSLGLVALMNFARKGNRQDLFIVAKYKYGTKMFRVYEITKYELSADVDKEILKSITDCINRIKKNVQFPIKEDVTLEEFKHITLNESDLETILEGGIL